MRLTAFTTIAILMLIGCRHASKKPRHATSLPTSAPAPVIERTNAPLPVPPAPDRPVAEGTAPLIYIVNSTAPLRIVETETGSTLASFTARAGSIVSIDEQAGIRAGGDLLVKGPLPAGRTYQIFLDEAATNEMRIDRIRPGR